MNVAQLLVPLLTAAARACGAADAGAYTAYVSNEKDNTISVVDLDKMQTVKSIPVGERPRGILLSKDKKYLYVCNGGASRPVDGELWGDLGRTQDLEPLRQWGTVEDHKQTVVQTLVSGQIGIDARPDSDAGAFARGR